MPAGAEVGRRRRRRWRRLVRRWQRRLERRRAVTPAPEAREFEHGDRAPLRRRLRGGSALKSQGGLMK
jgi:hypothetical protein